MTIESDAAMTAVYARYEAIKQDMSDNPLASGENVTIVGYSGSGILAQKAAKSLGADIVDNVVLIAAPFSDDVPGIMTLRVHSSGDFLSHTWVGSWNFEEGALSASYLSGSHAHGGYFDDPYLANLLNVMNHYRV